MSGGFTTWLPCSFGLFPSTSTTTFNNFDGCLAAWSATAANYGTCFGVDQSYTLSNWTITLITPPGGTAFWTFSIFVNGSLPGSPLQIIIGGSALTGTAVGSITVNPGDVLTVQCVPLGTPTAMTALFWDSKRVGSSGQPLTTALAGGTNIAANTSRYLSPTWGGSQAVPDEFTEPKRFPTAGTLSNLYVALSNDPGGVLQSLAVTLRQNSWNGSTFAGAASTALTTTINTGSTAGHDTTHTVTVAAGDIIDFLVVNSLTGVTNHVFVGYMFTPTTTGESVIMAESFPGQASGAGRTVYNWGETNVSTTLSLQQVPFHFACSIYNLYTIISSTSSTAYTAPASGQSIQTGINQNGSFTSLQVTGTNGGGFIYFDATHTVPVSVNDLICLEAITAGGSVGTAYAVHYGFVMLISQGGAAPSHLLALMGVGS